MSPDLIALVQSVLIEAIKVLGPAVATGYFTYRAMAVQYQSKLKELERTNEFAARDRLFKRFEAELEELSQDSKKVHEAIGMMLGMSSPSGGPPTESELATLRVSAAFARSVAKQLPLHCNSTLRAMKVANLETSDEYKKLQDIAGIEVNFPEDANYGQLHTSLFQLLDHHNLLTACTRLVTDRTLSAVFAPYVVKALQDSKQ